MTEGHMHESLHAYLLAAIDDVRAQFDAAGISDFRLDIEVSGRVIPASAQPRIAYRLSPGMYNSEGAASGARLDPVIAEVARRFEWGRCHDPLALPAPAAADE